jgi:hypothetical protein
VKDGRDMDFGEGKYDMVLAEVGALTYIGREEGISRAADLLKEGYAIKKNGVLYCNVPVTTEKSRKLFEEINTGLQTELEELCGEIRENITRIVKGTIPEQLRPFIKGYTETWIAFYAGVYLHEALYNKGFIAVPEKDDLTPVACWIEEK